MIRVLTAALLLVSCGTSVADKPVMAPVDAAPHRPAVIPKAAKIECEMPAWEPITLPTTAAEQVAGRHADRIKAEAVIAECERRRSSAVRAIRRGAAH